MAIDKERLKKQNAQNVYKKSHSKKSGEIDLGQAVKNNGYKVAEATKFHIQKHISNIDVKTLRKKRITKKFRQKLKQQRQNLQTSISDSTGSQEKSANEEVADRTVSTLYQGASIAVRYASKAPKKNKSSDNKNSASSSVKNSSINNSNSAALSETSNVNKTSTSFNNGNVSRKSNMLSSGKSQKNNNIHNSKKARYNNNRKKLFKAKKKAQKAAEKISGKDKAQKQALLKLSALMGKWAVGVISFIMTNWMICLLIMLLLLIGIGGEYKNQMEQQIAYTYPASEVDITKTIEYWQMLQVSTQTQHSNIPEMEGIAGKFDKKESSVCDFMNDNNALLSFLSAYYIPYVDSWHFEDAKDVITDVFTSMYSITYSLEPEQIIETKTYIIPEAILPSPLPSTHTILAKNGTDYVVKVSQPKEIIVLKYNIEELMTWEEILDLYLSDEQREKYQNYYEFKGGMVKAFSSPFAFAWESYITSPFGYRYWDDGSTEFHKGVDFGVPHGTEELAIADGTVVKIYNSCTHDYPKDYGCGCGGNYGNYVDILTDDGVYYISYGHMAQVYVNVGDKVKNGQVLGTAGCTGWSTGNHLHLELRLGHSNGELIDPLTFIQPYVPIQETTNTTEKGD